ncbi:DNA-binding transcriptional regulator, LysR family [Lentzea fradiae]|uniref:DNA-binding transcriptional regulator, LysR family n=1 Tax=Lentzea fradiae TaxID=200378 RepID=A0A1G7XHA2_9PSEU|nr:LysR family transcriptional regulator [Lentzea fradiae]SDG83487.1 DNA-binding transcriptional regulator, LysR family [Lentzea fradiae]
MDLKQLSTFYRVTTHMSFTKAATELRYAQSSVTAQIKGLEAALGSELFERLGGKIRLTPFGERLVPYAERILALVDEARCSLAEQAEPSGTLTVAAVESVISYRMSGLLEFFHHRYPRLQLVVQAATSEDARESVRKGVQDLGFLVEVETRHDGLETRVLGPQHLVAVVAPGHPLHRTSPVLTSDLRAFPVLVPGTDCSYRASLQDELRRGAEEPVSVLEFGNIESVKQGIAAGVGVGVLPEAAVAGSVRDGRLSVLDWQPSFEVSAQIVWRQGRQLTREARIFVDLVTQTAGVDDESLAATSS